MTQKKNEAAKDVANFATVKSIHGSLPKTKALLNQAVADLYTAHVALHQVHWYMRGRGFMVWHPKMDEYMEALDGHLDEISERLITLGGAPYSSLAEFSQHTKIQETVGSFDKTMEENLERVLSIYRYLAGLFQEGLDVTDEEGDDVTNDIFNGAKTEAEKTIWMLAAELGQAPNL
ncbi:Dps family protein [Streptococcus oricebi]|uniref:DNA starvation/stationary phase protection protein n=1 Tax=Streptococcus oricebi TaxID=1547447 RepID=A0ABS5B1N4_9STRE|nr:Dps family protein [Streptococcus oricebi]MBP2622740.1 DNA starvation/stationary phase protection protein [Streptococcus oricebi]